MYVDQGNGKNKMRTERRHYETLENVNLQNCFKIFSFKDLFEVDVKHFQPFRTEQIIPNVGSLDLGSGF